MKKPKPMTAKEKKLRAEIRADLREWGVIPPKKKPLNRKRFIQEARDEYNTMDIGLTAYPCMLKAIGWTMTDYHPTLESVGVAKMLKVACEIARFHDLLKQEGRTEYTADELYERIQHILEA